MRHLIANIAAGQTDAELVAAVSGKRIVVCAVYAKSGDTGTSIVFNSKGSGAGTAISPVYDNGNNGDVTLPPADAWFSTIISEGLTVTTGAGSTTAINVLYNLV